MMKMPYMNAMKACFFQRRFFSAQKSPVLPVLDLMVQQLKDKTENSVPLEKTAVVYIHHALNTSVNVLEAMFQLGLLPQNTFVLGKHYSDNEEVIKKITDRGVYYQPCSAQIGLGRFYQSFTRDINWLWSEVVKQIEKNVSIKNVLILDHGGNAISFVPASILNNFNVVGMEKTSGGLFDFGRGGLPPFPLINMANCAVKKILEPSLIADAVVAKLDPLMNLRQPTRSGVIGHGAIGQAIAQRLLSLGHKVMVYDNNPEQLKGLKTNKNFLTTTDQISAVNFSNLIFGCSGQDVSRSMEAFRLAVDDKTLISCSSEDREFLTLLHHIQQLHNGKVAATPLKDVVYENDFGSKITILRGGFPYNFDHSGESVPANDIQLTRALTLASVFQAIDFFKKVNLLDHGGLYALDAELQKWIVKEWLKTQPLNRYSQETLDNFGDLDYITKNSLGIQEPLSFNLDPVHSEYNNGLTMC